MAIILVRVEYGGKEIPKDQREYQINGKGPVGTLKEWEEFLGEVKGNDFKIIDPRPEKW